MAPRRLLGCVCVAVLAVCAWTGCKDKDKPGQTGKAPSGADLMTRCEEVGKACGELDKHVQKIVEECKLAAKDQFASGCTDKAIAAYDCYQKQLCGKSDKVWALEDLRVLSERHGKCTAERDALRACVEPPAK